MNRKGRDATEDLWLRDLLGTVRFLAGDAAEIPPEVIDHLRSAAAVLAEPAEPPGPPPVSEWYRITWTETSVEHCTEYVTAAELASMAGAPMSSTDQRPARSSDPASIAAVIDDPYDHDLDNALAALDTAAGELAEFGRTNIEIVPVDADDMRHDGHYPLPRMCYTCGALCHWTGTGYAHTGDGSWPRGLPPEVVDEPERRTLLAAHTAGQPLNDDVVVEYDGTVLINGQPYVPRDHPDTQR